MAILQLHDGYADLGSLKVSRGGRFEALTQTEGRLLQYLYDRGGDTVSREELLRAVWGYREGVRSRTLDTYLWRLRRKLESDPTDPRLLLTEARHGISLKRLPPPPAEDAGEGVVVVLLAPGVGEGALLGQNTVVPWQGLRSRMVEHAGIRGLLPYGEDAPGQLTLVGIAAEPALDEVLGVLQAPVDVLLGPLQAGLERTEWGLRARQTALELGRRRARRLAILAFPGSVLASVHFAQALPPRRMQTLGQCPLTPGGPTEPLLSPLPAHQTPALPPLEVVVFGRQAELDALTAAAVTAQARLISVVGPGGIGKSTLARAWVERALAANLLLDTLLPCELGPSATEADLPRALARVLEVSEERLEVALAARGPVLVLLDRAESVLPDAAPRLARWMAVAPESRWLLTAHTPTHLPGEVVVPVGPLSPQAAAALLLDRVAGLPGYQELAPSDTVVGSLVEAIGRTPLALELASTRARLFRPAQLLARLRQDPEALQTPARPESDAAHLDGAVTFTWSLLPPEARAGLSRLATFPADFSIEAAEAVLADQDGSPTARIEELADASLLRLREAAGLDDVRLLLPAPVRDFALKRLLPEEARRARVQAARWLVQASALWLEDAQWSPRQYDGLRRLRAEQHNLLAAFDTLDAEDGEAALHLLVACQPLIDVLQTLDPSVLLERLERLTGLVGAAAERADWLRCSLLVRLQRYTEALHLAEALLDASTLAPRYQDEVRLLRVMALLLSGQMDAATSALAALRPLFLASPLPPWRLAPSAVVGTLYTQLPGGLEDARAVARHALAAAEALEAPVIIDRLHLFLAKCNASDGSLPVAALPALLARCQRLIDNGARAVAQPYRLNLARAQLALQGPDAARPTLVEVRRQAILAGDTFELDNIDLVIAELHLLADDLEAARTTIDALIERALARQSRLRLRRALQRRALLCLLAHTPAEGLQALHEAHAENLTAFDRFHHACIAVALHALAGDPLQAQATLQAAAPPAPRAALVSTLAAAWIDPTRAEAALALAAADSTLQAAGNSGSILRILVHGLRRLR